MLSKTIFAAAALAVSVNAVQLPSCWSTCFEEYQLDSEGCLCSDSLGAVISSCIQSGCSTANSTAYEYWLSSYCNRPAASSISSNTWTAPVSSSVAVETSSSATVSIPVYTPSESPSASAYPSASPSASPSPSASASTPVAPYPSTTASESVCTASTTLIWRGSTSVSVYAATPVASGTGYLPVSGYGATHSAMASSYTGPYGNAAPVATAGAGLAMAAAGFAALLI